MHCGLAATSQRKACAGFAGRERPVGFLRLQIGNQLGDPYHGCAARDLDRATVRGVTDIALQCLRQGSVSSSCDWRAMNAIAASIRKYLAGGPTTKRAKDVAALTLFSLLSLILVGLIAVGML